MKPTIDESILLTCSRCGRAQREARMAHDPPNAVELNFAECDRCDRGDFESLAYFDAQGQRSVPRFSR